MTIGEAIRHCEEVAEEQEKLYRICPASESDMSHCDGTKDCRTLKNGKNKGCQKCAAEHRQLANWLKELKQLREQEPCDDCVSRQAAKNKKVYSEERHEYVIPVAEIDWMPSAQPERKKGRWIPVDSYSAFGGDEATWIAHGNPVAFYYCSECKEEAYAGEDGEPLLTDYCPNCGAYMRGEQDE